MTQLKAIDIILIYGTFVSGLISYRYGWYAVIMSDLSFFLGFFFFAVFIFTYSERDCKAFAFVIH